MPLSLIGKIILFQIYSQKKRSMGNPSRIWANAAILVFSVSLSYFFIQISSQLPHPGSQKIVRYLGSAGMFFNFLIVTPYHDPMVVVSSICFLISLFYLTVYIFKLKQHLLKILCVICLLIFYATLFIYGAGPHEILPHMQKLTFFSVISLVLFIHYRYKA